MLVMYLWTAIQYCMNPEANLRVTDKIGSSEHAT
jgi:hypothetical protein